MKNEMIVDPPSPFAGLAEWQEFLTEMQSIKDPSPTVKQATQQAEQMVRKLSAPAK